MKYSRVIGLVCAALFTVAATASCSQKWDGYENTELDQYVTVGQYKGVTITLGSTEVTDTDIQSKIDEMLAEHQGEEEITGRAVEADDYVKIDYSSTVDGVADTNFMGSGTSVQVGSNTFFSTLSGDIEAAFIGHNVGDTFTVNGTFPDYYKNDYIENEDFYNGKSIVFEITINEIYSIVTPELTDELVAEVSSVSDTVEQYKEELRTQLQAEKAEAVEQQKLTDAWAAVMDTAKVIKYPQTEVDAAVKEMKNYYTSLAQQIDSALTLEDYITTYLNMSTEDFEKEALSYAQGTVAEQLVLYSIIQKENITVSDAEYETGLSEYATKYSFESPEAFESYYGTDLARQSMLWDKTIAFIIDNATILQTEETSAES